MRYNTNIVKKCHKVHLRWKYKKWELKGEETSMKKDVMVDMTSGRIAPQILKFAMPVLLGLIFQRIYNFADSYIVGHFLGDNARAAVSVAGVGMYLMFSLIIGLTTGVTVVMSQYYGAKEEDKVVKTFFSSIYIALGMTIIVTVVGLIVTKPLLIVLQTPDEVLDQAVLYLRLICAGCIGTMLYNWISAVLRSLGNSVVPLVFLGISSLLNIVFDVLFVAVLPLGVGGAAFATVLAQIIAFVICWIYMIRKYEILRLQKEELKDPSPIMVKEMISAGMSMGFMSSLINIGTLTLQTAINKLGKDIIIAHTAARKITEIFMIMFSVFGQTMATYCGQNMGAGKIDRVKRGIWLAIVYTAIWSGLTIIASYTIGGWLVYLVTGSHNKTVILNATNYLKFDTLFYIVTTLICILRNAMQGLGDHITPLISSGLEMAGKIVIAATLVPWLGYTGVIICEPIVWSIMVIPLLIQTFRMPILRTEKTDGKI